VVQRYLAAMGRPDEAIAEESEPRNSIRCPLITNAALARPFYNARRYDEAIAQSGKTSRDRSALRRAHYWLGLDTSRNPMYGQAIARVFTRPS